MTFPAEVQSTGECPHGLRPGTTVCLRCRQDARAVARAKRVRFATRAGLATMGVAVVIALVVGAWNALAGGAGDDATPAAQVSATGTVEPPTRPAARTVARENPGPAFEPAIPQGRRDLGDSIYAVRDGAQVTVYFDTDSLRTRFDWKFEGVVRATLPLVFGSEITAALDSIPAGSLASGGNLVHDLPSRGIPIRMGSRTLRVWPVVRQGRDGPLVMAYRAVPSR